MTTINRSESKRWLTHWAWALAGGLGIGALTGGGIAWFWGGYPGVGKTPLIDPVTLWLVSSAACLAIAYFLFKLLYDLRLSRDEKRKVEDARRRVVDHAGQDSTHELRGSSALFDLHSKELVAYQIDTQQRAGWSFIFAIIAMVFGLAFLVSGYGRIIDGQTWEKASVAAVFAALGAALSAFITKTFIDVHRTSLNQMNRYFRQPAIAMHVLTAQRLADAAGDEKLKLRAYRAIIARIINLISEDSKDLPFSAGDAADASLDAGAKTPTTGSAGAQGEPGPPPSPPVKNSTRQTGEGSSPAPSPDAAASTDDKPAPTAASSSAAA
jgi:hypothetical protein